MKNLRFLAYVLCACVFTLSSFADDARVFLPSEEQAIKFKLKTITENIYHALKNITPSDFPEGNNLKVNCSQITGKNYNFECTASGAPDEDWYGIAVTFDVWIMWDGESKRIYQSVLNIEIGSI